MEAQEVVASLDPEWQKYIEYLKQDQCGFVLLDGLVCRQIHTGTATIVILMYTVLRAELLEIFPNSPVDSHLGWYNMLHQSFHKYYWQGMYHNCRSYIHNFLIYLEAKVNNQVSPGKLQPLPIPMYLSEEVPIDLITYLSCVSAGYDSVGTIVG